MKQTIKKPRSFLVKLGMLPLVIFLVAGLSSFTTDPIADPPTATSIWIDIVTPNLHQTKEFYGSLFGWTFSDTKMKGLRNVVILADNKAIGSIFEIKNAEASVWIPAISVSSENLKQKAQSLVTKGAKIAFGPIKIPSRGAQVVFEGSQGEEFSLISNFAETSLNNKGEGTWMGAELWASEVGKAKRFYEDAFNVELVEKEFNDRPYWYLERQGQKIAGMIENPITNQGTQWVPYIYSENPTNIATKAAALGGYVVAAPSSALMNNKLAVVQDPNGAIFCIHTNK